MDKGKLISGWSLGPIKKVPITASKSSSKMNKEDERMATYTTMHTVIRAEDVIDCINRLEDLLEIGHTPSKVHHTYNSVEDMVRNTEVLGLTISEINAAVSVVEARVNGIKERGGVL